ncbi:unnamed protein product [Arctogadus glacialis]
MKVSWFEFTLHSLCNYIPPRFPRRWFAQRTAAILDQGDFICPRRDKALLFSMGNKTRLNPPERIDDAIF